jgi:hypothetical protein
MGSKSPQMILMVVLTLVCAAVIVPAAAGALLLLSPSVFAQQEETSLGEEEDDMAESIVSNVLEGSDNDIDDDQESDSDADDDMSNQNAMDTTTIEPNQEEDQTVDQDDDDTVIFGDSSNTQTTMPLIDQDQGAANLALSEALDLTVGSTLSPPLTQEPECSLEITADKEIYGPGDVVTITITNTGDEPLEFSDSLLGLEIKNVDTGEVFPINAAQVITTLEPGESRTFEFTYEDLVSEIGSGLISATVVFECADVKEVTFGLSAAPSPEENGKIVFASIRDGNFEIYVMNGDGSDQHNISNNPAQDAYPSWSPDGTKIVFSSTRDGREEIYVMNADGSDERHVLLPIQLYNLVF